MCSYEGYRIKVYRNLQRNCETQKFENHYTTALKLDIYKLDTMRNCQIQIENLYYVTENEKDLNYNIQVEEKTLILKNSCKHFSNI